MKDRRHDEAMADIFRADPSYAAELMAEVVRDANADGLAILKRQQSVAFATKETSAAS